MKATIMIQALRSSGVKFVRMHAETIKQLHRTQYIIIAHQHNNCNSISNNHPFTYKQPKFLETHKKALDQLGEAVVFGGLAVCLHQHVAHLVQPLIHLHKVG